MENTSMTALVSCFARAYHSKSYKYKIYNDCLAERILSKEEYDNISENMKKEIGFFNPSFIGTDEAALRWIVDNQLSPSVLARSVFTETKLKNEIRLGVNQYLIFASGYDTSAYKEYNDLSVFEIDKFEMIKDKIYRLDKANIKHENINYISCDFIGDNLSTSILNSNYDPNKKTFCSLLGISYYLSKSEFEKMIFDISNILCEGSSIVIDFPNEIETNSEKINKLLAHSAGEEMKSNYTFDDMESIANKNSLLIYEYLDYEDINKEYFYNYNKLNPNNKISAPKGVNYCLLVKMNK